MPPSCDVSVALLDRGGSGSYRKPSRARVLRAVPIALALTVVVATAMLAPAAPAHAAAVTCRGVRATIVGTSGSDEIHGTPGRDVIAGLDGDDTIYAGGGNDLVCGGDGADRLFGGAGNDRLYGEKDLFHIADEDGTERVGDTLNGGPGDDTLDAGFDQRPADNIADDTYSWDGSPHGVHLDLRSRTARGDGRDTFAAGTSVIVGSAYGDVVDGTNHRDRIDTGNGPDVVRGRGGGDFISVDGDAPGDGQQGDQVWGGDGNDWITSRHGQDHLDGGGGNDYISARGASNDVISGGAGDDDLWVEIGNKKGPQTYDGGPGSDSIQVNTDAINRRGAASTGTYNLATGRMTFTLAGRRTSLTVHTEQALLATRATSWIVTGTPGNDAVVLSQDAAGSTFNGHAGDDYFGGTDGNDTFNGGPGNDSSRMGLGDDTCISVENLDGADCEHVSP